MLSKDGCGDVDVEWSFLIKKEFMLQPPVQLRVLKITHVESFQIFSWSIGFLKHFKEISFDGKEAPLTR